MVAHAIFVEVALVQHHIVADVLGNPPNHGRSLQFRLQVCQLDGAALEGKVELIEFLQIGVGDVVVETLDEEPVELRVVLPMAWLCFERRGPLDDESE